MPQNNRIGINLRKVLEIIDEDKIPRKYLNINRKLIEEDLKAGVEISGAKISSKKRCMSKITIIELT